MILVPARTQHAFVDFTDDFRTWVILWGPDGAKRPSNAVRSPRTSYFGTSVVRGNASGGAVRSSVG